MSQNDLPQEGNTPGENTTLLQAASMSVAEEFRVSVELVVRRYSQNNGEPDEAFVKVVEGMTRAALMGRRNAIVDVVNDPDSMKKLSSQNIEWIRERLNALNEFLLPTK